MASHRGMTSIFSMLVMLQFTLLLIEFIIGMVVNLYTTIPQPVRGSFFMSSGGVAVIAHIGMGALISFISVMLLFLALMQGNRTNVVFTASAFIFIVAAAFSGLAFLFAGQDPVFSLLMAVFFIFGFSMYLFPLVTSMKIEPRQS
ncbi:MAG: hypothetical protein B2I17_00585 [Thermoplasmatales archaeon B_DKE]|nr:MAG: hypothetical protein B2I17_00585 [Thermoplasmatales archaeon B_DKE]QRF75642.1 hypothetical protein Thermo_01148 [Thermoplasmatales archaeon]